MPKYVVEITDTLTLDRLILKHQETKKLPKKPTKSKFLSDICNREIAKAVKKNKGK